jgi:3-deoxy-D-manno-octulosonic-acid transferase
MDNFAEIAERMRTSGAAEQVDDEATLIQAVSRRLADPALVRTSGAQAREFALAEDGVLEAVLDQLRPWLSGSEAAHAGA